MTMQNAQLHSRDQVTPLRNTLARVGLCCLALTAFFILQSKYAVVWALIPFGVFALFFAYRYLAFCVLAYCAVIPLESFQASASLSVSKGLGGALVLVCLFKLLLQRKHLHLFKLPVLKPIALWWIFLALSSLTTIHFAQSLGQIRLLFAPMAIFFFVVFVIDTRERFVWSLMSFALSATLSAVLALLFAERDLHSRLIGFGDDPNFFAAVFVVGYAVCLTFTMLSRGKARLMWLLFTFLQVVLILQSQSRAGIVAVAVQTLFVLPAFFKKVTSRTLILLIIGVCIAGTAFVVAAPEKLSKRFTQTFTAVGGRIDPSTQRRLSYIPVAINNTIKNPLLGSGPGTYPLVYARTPYSVMWAVEEGDYYRYAHNTFLEMYSDLGLIGGTAFLSIFLLSLITLNRTRKYLIAREQYESAVLVKGVMLAFTGLLVMLLTISNSFNKPLWLLVALAATASVCFTQEGVSGGRPEKPRNVLPRI